MLTFGLVWGGVIKPVPALGGSYPGLKIEVVGATGKQLQGLEATSAVGSFAAPPSTNQPTNQHQHFRPTYWAPVGLARFLWDLVCHATWYLIICLGLSLFWSHFMAFPIVDLVAISALNMWLRHSIQRHERFRLLQVDPSSLLRMLLPMGETHT